MSPQQRSVIGRLEGALAASLISLAVARGFSARDLQMQMLGVRLALEAVRLVESGEAALLLRADRQAKADDAPTAERAGATA